MSVTFDERHGYIASAPELRTVVARAASVGGFITHALQCAMAAVINGP